MAVVAHDHPVQIVERDAFRFQSLALILGEAGVPFGGGEGAVRRHDAPPRDVVGDRPQAAADQQTAEARHENAADVAVTGDATAGDGPHDLPNGLAQLRSEFIREFAGQVSR